MSDFSPMHNAAYAKTLVADLVASGHSYAEIFEGSGLTIEDLEGDPPLAPYDQIAALYENAARLTGNELIGLQRGGRRDWRLGGLISYVGTSSPTVRDLLMNVAQYRRVFSSALEMETQRLDSHGELSWHYRVPASVGQRQFTEASVAGLISAIRQQTDRAVRPLVLSFAHPRNSGIKDFQIFFGCEVLFGAPRNMIRLRETDLALPLVTADNMLLKVLVDHCERVLRESRQVSADIIYKVERSLSARLSTGEAQADCIAADLGLSRRTLSRRLAEEGTSFQDVLARLRGALAQRYLQESNISISEIAYLLGYADVSSFNAAFKRWTDKTPGQMRQPRVG
jgi:AraC-like DNA-binding protein